MVNHDRLIISEELSVDSDDLYRLANSYHIRKVTLFGSAARGELGPDSDIDLLVEFEPGRSPSLGEMVDIRDGFSKLLGGRRVDVATSAILKNPFRRRTIEKDMKDLYAA